VARRHGRGRRLIDDEVRVELVQDAAPEAPPDPELIRQSTEAIDRVPAAAQIVVRLHYLEGLTLAEIAEALQLPIGTVKSRLAYGLQCLRSEMLVSSTGREPATN